MRNTEQALSELGVRMKEQRSRLSSPPLPVAFTYDRNGVRLGIAALEDETRELWDAWQRCKRHMTDPHVITEMAHEALDIAAVAMLIYEHIPEVAE